MTKQELQTRIDTSINWDNISIEKESQSSDKGKLSLSQLLKDLESIGKLNFQAKIVRVGKFGLNLNLPSGKVSIGIHDLFDADGDLIASGADCKRDIVFALAQNKISKADVIITPSQTGHHKRVGCSIRFNETWFDAELSASGLQSWVDSKTKGIKPARQSSGKIKI